MRLGARTRGTLAAAACALALGAGAAPAQAFRPLLSGALLNGATVPGGDVEGACGVAVASGSLYVSDYYRHRVDVFSTGSGSFSSQIAAPNPLDGVCGLAVAPGSGALYANEWHEGVVRLAPTLKTFDSGHESTAVAVDAAGNVYAVDRTYVAVYQPSGEPLLHEGQPLKIGVNHLGDAYGVAVSGAKVYVADAATNTVEVFEPATDPATPVAEVSHDFTSLTDGALAIDSTNGHLLVLDNLQPGYESPEAAIDEFDSSGAFLDQIKGNSSSGPIIAGEPSGMSVSGGTLLVTSGNSEGSQVFQFGPYATAGSATLSAAGASFGAALSAAASAPPASAASGRSSRHRPVASASEVVQHGNIRVGLDAKLTPKKLPRSTQAAVHFSLAAQIASTDDSVPPQLRKIAVKINRNGHLNTAGTPRCRIEQIQPSSTEGALEACGRSLVGEGSFSARVLLAQQAPFPSDGEIVAFNGTWQGKPAILAHIYGTEPVPTSYTLPFTITKIAKGTYGTALSASLPRFTSKWGYVTAISLHLGRSGGNRAYLTAACPAPKGFSAAVFPLARASLSFGEGGPKSVGQTLSRSCGVR
jgi:DNA-binding beta-propeller fold protein YncE